MMLGDYIYEDAWGERRVRLFDTQEAYTLDRISASLHPVPHGSRLAGSACRLPLARDLGRPRSRQRLRRDSRARTRSAAATACGSHFPARRAAAYQAYFEHMPMRPSRLLPGMAVRIYGSVDWGTLARFYLLDNRQYRSAQVCPNPPTPWRCDTERSQKILFSGAGGGSFVNPEEPSCKAELADPSRTCWAPSRSYGSTARLPKAKRPGTSCTGRHVRDDQGQLERIASNLHRRLGGISAGSRTAARLARPTHDRESGRADRRHPFLLGQRNCERSRPPIRRGARDIVDRDQQQRQDGSAAAESTVRFHDGNHNGYVRCDLDRGKLRADIVGIDDRLDPRSGRSVLASYEVRAGDPRAYRV